MARRKTIRYTSLFILLFIFGAIAFALHFKIIQPTQQLTLKQLLQATPSTTQSDVLGEQTANSSCHSNGILPDANCTPGSIDDRVTQSNIHQTICTRGYTQTVRPPVEYTNKLKREQIQAYGYADTNPHDYEEDHLISLELGGNPTDPKNLWPEPGASPNSKDKIENLCNQKVCDGQMTLAEAQKEISTNWQTACQ